MEKVPGTFFGKTTFLPPRTPKTTKRCQAPFLCGTFLAVERMGQGASPAEAAADVIRRVGEAYDLEDRDQVGVITLAPSGEWSSAALRPGFRVAVRTPDRDDLLDPEHVLLP